MHSCNRVFQAEYFSTNDTRLEHKTLVVLNSRRRWLTNRQRVSYGPLISGSRNNCAHLKGYLAVTVASEIKRARYVTQRCPGSTKLPCVSDTISLRLCLLKVSPWV